MRGCFGGDSSRLACSKIKRQHIVMVPRDGTEFGSVKKYLTAKILFIDSYNDHNYSAINEDRWIDYGCNPMKRYDFKYTFLKYKSFISIKLHTNTNPTG